MRHHHILLAGVSALLVSSSVFAQGDGKITEGRLEAIGAGGKALGPCPLKHTEVDAEISGIVARVTVTQQFHNPFKDKIEAIYVFPLHQDAAVDDMTMTVGDRVVKGLIKERGEAKRIYEQAKARGNVASLLDQERPNIFTQSVANIKAGQQVTITIRYSQTISWEDGRLAFDFPTVVGPRYIPGSSNGNPEAAGGTAAMPSLFRKPNPKRGPEGESPVVNPAPVPPTDQVPDADRITPPVIEEGYRTGHDISITVRINAGRPIDGLTSVLHEVTVEHPDGDTSRALVRLADKAVIPNRDFAINYRTTGDEITDAVLTHTDERGKYFTLILQPPARVKQEEIVSRELVFVLDTSGSMGGFPIETSKAMMRRAIENLRPADCFNLVTFSGNTSVLFERPVANTEKNRHKALGFIDTLRGSGGTEMMTAINTALGGEHDPKRVRIVCFLTDGYVGNDLAIVDAVKKHAKTTRVFSFGIGNSVNRFLLDSMARAGRGAVHYVLTHEQAQKAADKFYERIDAPVLTDVALDFGGLAVEEVYPKQIEDLFAAKPIVVKGRYTKPGQAVIKLKGVNAAGIYQKELPLTLPAENPANEVLAPQWARAKVEDLMLGDMTGLQQGQVADGLKQAIIGIGLTYHLLTQFTSFVAVEELRVTEGGVPRTIRVPVEMPQGVSYAGVFGEDSNNGVAAKMSPYASFTLPNADAGTGGGGHGYGTGTGAGSGPGRGFRDAQLGIGALIPTIMKGRCTQGERARMLKQNGGTPAVEEGVKKSLDWLKGQQAADGSWGNRGQPAMTGLALLCYLGHCEFTNSKEYGDAISKAISFLVNTGLKNGGKMVSSFQDDHWVCEHGIATYALSEALAFSRTQKFPITDLDKVVEQAAAIIIAGPNDSGAWNSNYASGRNDISVTGWQMQALKAAKAAKVKTLGLEKAARKATVYLTYSGYKGGGLFADSGSPKPALTGVGVLCLQQWDYGNTKPAMEGADFIKQGLADRGKGKLAGQPCALFSIDYGGPNADLYAYYYAAQAMRNAKGRAWELMNKAILESVLPAQGADGHFKTCGGTSGALGSKDIFNQTLSTLILEVYYRFLPGTSPG